MKRTLTTVAVLAVLAYGGVCAALYAWQDSLLYHPSAEVSSDAADALILGNDGEQLKVWRVGRGADALLYFGGNGENVANNIPRFARLLAGHTVYLMNYRGYGGSSGEPDEAGFYRDAAALFDNVRQRHERVSVIGRSLGSGVATWLAAERPVERMVLVTPYDSVENVARKAYPFAPVSLLLRDKFRSIDRVERISAPVMILVADRDDVIPHANTMALASRFPPGQLRVRTIENTNHQNIARAPAYAEALGEFLLAPGGAQAQDRTQVP